MGRRRGTNRNARSRGGRPTQNRMITRRTRAASAANFPDASGSSSTCSSAPAQAQPQSARQEIQAPVPIPIPDPIPAPVLPAPAPAAVPPVSVQAPAQQVPSPPPEPAQVHEIAEVNNGNGKQSDNIASSSNLTVPFSTVSSNSNVAQGLRNVNNCVSIEANSLIAHAQGEVSMNRTPDALTSICAPLGADLPQVLRTKIIKGEYVDFGQILEKSEFRVDERKGVALTVNNQGNIIWQENNSKRPINSIHSWTSAFLIFSSVYLEAHPGKAQDLLKYAHIIRTGASRFGGWGWKNYDLQFRARMQHNPSRSWACIDGELWALYMGNLNIRTASNFQARGINFQSRSYPSSNFTSKAGSNADSPLSRSKKSRSELPCFNFNGTGCSRSRCAYKHACIKCSEYGHGAQSCNKFQHGKK